MEFCIASMQQPLGTVCKPKNWQNSVAYQELKVKVNFKSIPLTSLKPLVASLFISHSAYNFILKNVYEIQIIIPKYKL